MVRTTAVLPRALSVVAGLLCLSAAPSRAHADSLLSWNFENVTSVGSVSIAAGSPGFSGITGYASQTGGGPAEQLQDPGDDGGFWLLTRNFGTQYPYLEFQLTRPLYLQSLTFDHQHNHNYGLPTYPNYYAQLQIDTGSGFSNVGSPVFLTGSNIPQYGASVTLGIGLQPGTYHIRWMPRGLAYGSDTSSEYFALNNVSLNGVDFYSVKALYDTTKSYKLGSTIPLKIQVCDANGVNVSSSALTVNATGLTQQDSSANPDVEDSGNANPDNNFRYDASLGGYIFNLSTKGLSSGTWKLWFTIGTDPTQRSVQFDIK